MSSPSRPQGELPSCSKQEGNRKRYSLKASHPFPAGKPFPDTPSRPLQPFPEVTVWDTRPCAATGRLGIGDLPFSATMAGRDLPQGKRPASICRLLLPLFFLFIINQMYHFQGPFQRPRPKYYTLPQCPRRCSLSEVNKQTHAPCLSLPHAAK